tara:strand:+ start:77 stop:847 length:771 start_codon:yes stop_codon:yes gene_type:complete
MSASYYPSSQTKPLSHKERTSILVDDNKYIEHVHKWLHYIRPDESLKKKRVGKGRRHFDYLTGQDVIRMLNDIFLRGWEQELVSSQVRTGIRSDGKWEAVAVVRLRFIAPMPDPMPDFRQENIGDKDSVGRSEIDVVKDLEKSAVTDALKRCVKNLALRLGLFLYYEEQEWTNDVALAPPPPEKDARYAQKEQLKEPWAKLKSVCGAEVAASLWTKILQKKNCDKNTVPLDFLPELNRVCGQSTPEEIIVSIDTIA